MILKVTFLVIAVTTKYVLGDQQYKRHTIGAIFYKDAEDLIQAVELSAEEFNFTVEVKQLSKRGEILELSEHVCELAKLGVIGIIDGTEGRASEHIQALSDTLDLPHVMLQHNDFLTKTWSVLNLFPSPLAYNMVLQDLITVKDWNNFTLLYVKGYSLIQVETLMKMGNQTDRPTVTVRELSGTDYRDVLTNARENGYTNFVVASPSRVLERLLDQAQQVSLMADEHSYIFISPDLFTLDLDRYRYGGVNMTGLRLVSLEKNRDLWNFTDRYNLKTSQGLLAEQLKTKVILAHDAVQAFAEGLKKVNVTTQSLSCDLFETWGYGSTLLNFMRTNKVVGLTNTLLFDGFGLRTDVTFDILELTPAGNQTIGTWKNNELEIKRPFVPSAELTRDTKMGNKTFTVLIALTPPYAYQKESSEQLEGNDRYEGFTVDLMTRLSEELLFSYKLEVEKDYGSFNNDTKKWSGMVDKIREDKADFAICDLTITVERQKGIDFSMPFMSLGISILYKEPSKQPPEMFSFMAVFSNEVWYYMVLIQLALGVVMIFSGRISHKEWQNPVPCIESPEDLTNQFTFANSVWLIIGSVMQQGSEIAPIAVAPRMITSVWWFFTMVIVALYTGTLVAFLTIEKNVLPFKTAADLYDQKSISYGAKVNGTTTKFFKDSNKLIYRQMYERMKSKNWLVESNDQGVELAENTNYAFFSESTSIEYYQERHCDLLMVGGLLDSKSYGIGMKIGSEYKTYIDQALLKLKERGEIQKLKDIWWKEKRGGGNCEETQAEEPKQLGMKNMLGAFVVLGVGCVVGLCIAALDMLWGVFKRTVKYKTTFKEELIEELLFYIKFSGDIKPVKRPPNVGGSTEALAEAEGQDEVLSLPSIRSGRSTSTRRTSHSHSSRHSHDDLSVAFARRRRHS